MPKLTASGIGAKLPGEGTPRVYGLSSIASRSYARLQSSRATRRVGPALVGLLLAQPSIAQIPSSSAEFRGGPAALKDFVDGARQLKKGAACAFERNPAYTQYLLSTVPASDNESSIAYRIVKVMEGCGSALRRSMWIAYAPMRGAMAEAAYLARYPTAPDFTTWDRSAQALPKAWLEAKLTPDEASEVFAQDFALCVAAAAPAQADAILRTEPRGPAEDGTMRAIASYLGPCLVQGHKFTMDHAALRSYLAQALYRGAAIWPRTGAAVQKVSGQ